MIELRNVEKVYKTKKGVKTKALDNVNIRFREKGLVFILGKSGSGKSTLLNIIGGLDSVTSGEVIIDSKNTKKFKSKDYDYYRNTYIGFIFQEFNLLEEYNVYDNILLSMDLQKKKFPKERVDKLLSNVGLEGLGSRRINELSGGQKQRVAIARAIVKKPEVILADEPTGSLDSKTGEEIFKILKNISKEKLVIVVSHDEEAALKYGDEIIHIEDGKVLEEVKDYENTKEFKKVKSHLKVTKALKLSFMNLKAKKIRLFLTVLLMTMSLSFFGISEILTIQDEVYTHTKAMKDDNYNEIILDKNTYYNKYIKDYTREGYEDTFTISEINEIEDNNLKTYELNTLYENNSSITFDFKNVKNDSAYYTNIYINDLKFIEIDNIEEKYIGKIPQKFDEIMIHSYLADYIMKFGALKYYSKIEEPEYYFPETYQNIIDDGIYLKLGSTKVKIVGIILDNNKKYDKFKTISYMEALPRTGIKYEILGISYDLHHYNEFVEKCLKKSSQIYVSKDFIINIPLKENIDLDSNLYSYKVNIDGNNKYISQNIGYLDKKINVMDLKGLKNIEFVNNDEVYINTYFLDNISNQNYSKLLKEYIKKYQEKLLVDPNLEYKSETELEEEFLKNYLKENNIIDSNISFEFSKLVGDEYKKVLTTNNLKIKGVTLDDDKIYLSKGSLDKVMKPKKEVKQILIKNTSEKEMQEIFKKYPLSKKMIQSNTPYSNIIYNVLTTMKMLRKPLNVLALIFFIFAFILIINFITTSIYDNKKQIGILRALGTRKKDVFKIYLYEGLIIGLIAMFISLALCYLFSYYVNSYISSKIFFDVTLVMFSNKIYINFIQIVFIATFISALFTAYKIANMKPINAINNN